MSLIEAAYELAIADLDIDWHEIEGDKSNPLILETYKSVDDLWIPEYEWDDSEISWCSCYLNKKIQDAGGRGTRSAMAQSWRRWGKRGQEKRGNIVVYDRGNGYGHCGFFVRREGNMLYTLGGNESDTVTVKPYSADALLGFRESID